jgi:hypothetical protein
MHGISGRTTLRGEIPHCQVTTSPLVIEADSKRSRDLENARNLQAVASAKPVDSPVEPERWWRQSKSDPPRQSKVDPPRALFTPW